MALDSCVRKLVGIIWLVEAMGCFRQPTIDVLVDCDSVSYSSC